MAGTRPAMTIKTRVGANFTTREVPRTALRLRGNDETEDHQTKIQFPLSAVILDSRFPRE
jgi:hypothetical protein